MTDERIAIEALARCTFLPGSWNKRFAHSLNAMPENAVLTSKQRQTLWKLVHRYRRQMPAISLVAYKERQAKNPAQLAFKDALDCKPDDAVTRLVYADWLEENGQEEYAAAQRWMVERGWYPHLSAAGASYSAAGMKGCNYEWLWDIDIWQLFSVTSADPNYLGRWHHSREIAERALGKALSGQLEVMK